MKRDCSVVRDLLPNYIENLVSDETKQYLENHIAKCSECKQVLKSMEGEDTLGNVNTLEEAVEAKIIKRHKRLKLTLKLIAVVLLAIVLVSSISFCVGFIPINSVRSKAYKKLQELKGLDNYKLTIERTSNVFGEIENKEVITCYYRNGKYKEDCIQDVTMYYMNGEYIEEGLKQESTHIVSYNSDGVSNTLSVNKKTNEVLISKYGLNTKKGELFEGIYPSITEYSKDLSSKIYMTKEFDLREDSYGNKKYYVLTQYHNDVKTLNEYWINKETMMIDRMISKQENSSYKDEKDKYNISETKYTLELNVVDYEDVDIPYNELNSQEYHVVD